MAKLTRGKLNDLKGIVKHKISFKVDGKILDVDIFDTIDEEKIQAIIVEFLAMSEFKNAKKEYNGIEDAALAIMLLLKHLTDLPYENKETTEEALLDLINVTTVLNNKKTDNGNTIFQMVVGNIDTRLVDSITESMNKAIEIVNEKIGDMDAEL